MMDGPAAAATAADEGARPPPLPPACRPAQRLLAAHERQELCFWFRMDPQLGDLIGAERRRPPARLGPGDAHQLAAREEEKEKHDDDGNQGEGPASRPERLVEAELHVFKLFPQLPPPPPQLATDDSARGGANNIKFAQETQGSQQRAGPALTSGRERRRHQAGQLQSANRTATGGQYHLKTNLLEVSLLQVLPRKATTGRPPPVPPPQVGARPRNHEGAKDDGDDDGEFPLRLLDIRRIDLNSNGWETFYVKRAVEDWLRDARLNLGLVIKAKTMFDEPIRLGLIRFADAYDYLEAADEPPVAERLGTRQLGAQAPTPGSQRRRHLQEFGQSHQPLLVIYTTKSEAR